MPNRFKAAQRINSALSDLLKVQTEPGHLSEAEKAEVDRSVDALKAEYMALYGVLSSASYAEITGQLTTAKEDLEKIKRERDRFKNSLVKARSLAKTLGLVLRLI
ncbi:MAG: hypothetical protein NXI27_30645 [Alphaproteobacteria bacterium]|nr:hypothetical protein [Alphaproteobacteria bacterium]